MSLCYGYSHSHISPKAGHHNRWCTVCARIDLCLKQQVSVSATQANQSKSNKGGLICLLRNPDTLAPKENYRHMWDSKLYRNPAVQHQETVHSWCCSITGWIRSKKKKMVSQQGPAIFFESSSEMCISDLGFNYHVLRIENISKFP